MYEGKERESSSSSCDSKDDEQFEHSADERALEEVAGTWGGERPVECAVYFRHRISRCLHVTADETGMLLKCGRMVTAQYDKCNGTPRFLHPSCTACFRR